MVDLIAGQGGVDNRFCVYLKRSHRGLPPQRALIGFLLASFADFRA